MVHLPPPPPWAPGGRKPPGWVNVAGKDYETGPFAARTVEIAGTTYELGPHANRGIMFGGKTYKPEPTPLPGPDPHIEERQELAEYDQRRRNAAAAAGLANRDIMISGKAYKPEPTPLPRPDPHIKARQALAEYDQRRRNALAAAAAGFEAIARDQQRRAAAALSNAEHNVGNLINDNDHRCWTIAAEFRAARDGSSWLREDVGRFNLAGG